MGSHFLSILKFVLGWPLSIVALFFVGRIILSHQQSIINNIEAPNIILLFSAMLLFFLFYFTRSFIWKFILKELGHDIPLKTSSYLWEISELRRFVPGNIWSFLSRATLFSNINVSAKTTVKAIIIETESFLIVAFAVSLLGAVLYSNILLDNVMYAFFIPLFLILILAALCFVFGSLLSKYLKQGFISKIAFVLPQFAPQKNAALLLFSIFYLFLFGLGTYLATASITFISPAYLIETSVFFVFALLVGYLSFITPMGLGVRESVMVVGLSQFVTLGTAGVAAIFARIVLIVSEMLFLSFTYFWTKSKNKFAYSLENFFEHRKYEIVLGVLIGIYILFFTSVSFLRYDNFYTGRFDLGNMDQTVWNTAQGRIFQTNDESGEIISRLAVHADFMLVLLAPFYLIWEHPKMLLLIQTIVLAIGSIFVYAIGKNVLKNKNLSLVLALLFLLYPAVQYTNLYDFHAVTLVTTFLLGTFYFLYKKRYLLFLLLALLAALTKEQIWVIIALFGLYIFFRNVIARSPDLSGRRSNPTKPEIASPGTVRYLASLISFASNDKEKLLGIIVFLVSITMFYFLIWHAIPNAKGGEHFALSYYSEFGEDPQSIVKNIFLSPQKTVATLFQKEQLDYIRQIFQPLGFISLLSPLYLIFALPDILINTLSGNPKLHQIYYQYSAAITPFIFISAIYGTRSLKSWFPKIPYTLLTTYCLLLTAYAVYSYGPLPFARKPNIDMFTKPQRYKNEIGNYISNIPAHHSVAATNNIGSHLSQREKIFTTPNGIDKADIVVFLIKDDWRETNKKYFEIQIESVKKVQNDNNYKQVLKINETFMVFERRAEP